MRSNISPNRYFVYALIDPSDGLEFYIGKGCGNRAKIHIKIARQLLEHNIKPARGENRYKLGIITKILKSGKEPIIAYLAEKLTEESAFTIEERMIEFLGRRIDGSGILTNFTTRRGQVRHSRGGPKTPEDIKNFVDRCKGSMKGKHHSDATKRKMSQWQLGKIVSDETRRRISDKRKGRSYEQMHGTEEAQRLRDRKRSSMMGKNTGPRSPETIQKIRDAALRREASKRSAVNLPPRTGRSGSW